MPPSQKVIVCDSIQVISQPWCPCTGASKHLSQSGLETLANLSCPRRFISHNLSHSTTKGIMIILVWANVKSHTCGVSCCSCTVETLALISTLVGTRCILGVNGNGMPEGCQRLRVTDVFMLGGCNRHGKMRQSPTTAIKRKLS